MYLRLGAQALYLTPDLYFCPCTFMFKWGHSISLWYLSQMFSGLYLPLPTLHFVWQPVPYFLFSCVSCSRLAPFTNGGQRLRRWQVYPFPTYNICLLAASDSAFSPIRRLGKAYVDLLDQFTCAFLTPGVTLLLLLVMWFMTRQGSWFCRTSHKRFAVTNWKLPLVVLISAVFWSGYWEARELKSKVFNWFSTQEKTITII